MKTVFIHLTSINDVKKFNAATNAYGFDMDIVSGRYVVDAKSIMGIFSLDLSKNLELNVHSDSCEDFLADISAYIVK